MTGKPELSVVIPTYKRAHLLKHVFEGLKKQTCKDFEVVVVLKPSGDGTEEIVKKYKKCLPITLVVQNHGFLVDALNLGLKHSQGKIIAFLDDDAIPFADWIERHLKSYKHGIGGVAGNVIPATLRENHVIPLEDKPSEIIPIIPIRKPFLERIGLKTWSRPIDGLNDYLVYVSKAGVVEYNCKMAPEAWHKPVKSLLGMGANMSILSKAIEDFRFPSSWILGLSYEQFLGWYLWKKGYNIFFTPKAKVHHIVHGQTLTRNIRTTKRDTLRWIEYNLLFYRLYKTEPKLSRIHRITWIIFTSIFAIKRICKDKELCRTARLKSVFHSEIMGLKWILSRRIGGKYNPVVDLEKFF